MMLTVASFAEAGSRVSATGGPYAYIEAAFGPFAGLATGVLLTVSALSGVAVVTTLFAGSVLALAGLPPGGMAQHAIVLVVLTVVGVLNVRGVRWGVHIVEVMTAAKLVPLLAFVIVGAAFIEPAHLSWTTAPDSSALLGTAGIVIFAFMGIESGLAPSGEIREPSRTVPRAAFLALLAVCALYLAVQAVAQGILGAALGSARVTPLATAAGAVAGDWGRTVMLLGAAVSMLGFLCGSGLVNPRLLFALARDGFLPRHFASVHQVFRTPHSAIGLYTVIVAVLAATGTFERLLVISNISGLLVYAMVAVSAIRLRHLDVRADGVPFRTPGGLLVHVLAFAAVGGLLIAITTRQEIVGFAVLLAVTAAAYGGRRWAALRAAG